MLKKIVYWVYLNRVFTGLITGRDHWLHGLGPIWATLLPFFSIGEYFFIRLTGHALDMPLHFVLSGLCSIVLVIAADMIEVRKDWTKDFELASEMPVKTRAMISGVLSMAAFFAYLATVIFLFDKLMKVN